MATTTYAGRGDRILQDAVAARRHPLDVVGRILFVLPFAVNGVFHLMNAGTMAGAVPTWVPGGGELWVVITGVAMLAAAVSLLFDRLVEWSGPLLALLLGVYVVTLHVPQFMGGDQMAMQGILKDAALAGGALFLTAHRKRRWSDVDTEA